MDGGGAGVRRAWYGDGAGDHLGRAGRHPRARHRGRRALGVPEALLPALPAGSPRPFSEANTAEIHHADLRELLLPAPAGSTPDKALDGGWVKQERFLAEYRAEDRDELAQLLTDTPPRHIAARGWTMPDGTRARIYLIRFNSTAFATHVRDEFRIGVTMRWPLAGAVETEFDASWKSPRAVEGWRRTS